ncbi:LOW QUALITY PROTEIN: vacuolar protein sorting-associated protein 37C [Chanos chanos]|uniref:LOW QUALITY PROTEIN: vacuolar protein sorting-associated protein 37C n=1 Tax=Chanos chanos TaxID=29144 RepID=A0A6J2WJY5_CHACN|nr:LOW QUALITY PROTEIN: vacuolar protein sorting-associated protein 37C-like [Chanos chanos]
MEKLQDLNQSELEELLDNSERVESMALESDEIQNIQLEREMALASNRSLAEQNLDMKPRLERERERLVERYTELEEVRERYKQHCALRDSIIGQVSPEGLLTRLQTEGANTEAESETLADEFLEGSLSLDSFLERFLSLRSLAHKRRVRIEKLQEILRQKTEGGGDTMTSQPSANQQDPAAAATAAPSPWQHQPQQQQQPQQPSSKPSSASFSSVTPNSQNSALPYSPYPVGPPTQTPSVTAAAATSNPPPSFSPYPSQGSSFPQPAGYPTPQPAYGPSACPYPTQPSFPGPPGPPFGQFGPSAAPYPTPYSYGGYSYPTGSHVPPTQSPTGRPLYRPGFGVPQPYS